MKQQNEADERPPSKRVKMENTSQNDGADIKVQSQLFCKCYSKNQINLIMSAIMGLQNYTKYISVVIRHYEKSI